MDIEGITAQAGSILDDITESVEVLQVRIDTVNAIHTYLKHDDDMMLKYGALIGELFGRINVYTLNVDEVTLNLNDVMDGIYDEWPSQSVAGMVMIWDSVAASSLGAIIGCLESLERYMEYLNAINDDPSIEVQVNSKPVIH